MKAYKILIFIFSIIGTLGLLCSFFPKDGVRIGGISLEFPSIQDILLEDDSLPEAEDPEILIAKREEAIKEARQNDFMTYFTGDPARIHFPNDSIEYLDSFFDALENAMERPVRVMHYGDSQIEEDRISSVIRDSLQSRFGGGGPGLLPVLGRYYSLSISEASTSEPTRYMVYGPEEMRTGNNRYGVMGQKFHFDTTVTTTFSPIKNNGGPARYFNRLTILSSGGRCSASCKGKTQELEASEDVRHIRFTLPDSSIRASVTYTGSQDIYGIMLDNDRGVSLDNIAMRGCAGTVFTGISSAQLKDYFSTENVKLIILQYGGNVVPYMNSEKSISQYGKSIEKQISYLKKLAPEAMVLFIGPSDMSTSVQGRMQTYKQLPMIVDSLRTAVNNAGGAFWDMFRAMGGEGSMVKWVKNDPPLAGSDHVHFTPKGAEKMGGIFYESLMLYYDFYKFRKK